MYILSGSPGRLRAVGEWVAQWVGALCLNSEILLASLPLAPGINLSLEYDSSGQTWCVAGRSHGGATRPVCTLLIKEEQQTLLDHFPLWTVVAVYVKI